VSLRERLFWQVVLVAGMLDGYSKPTHLYSWRTFQFQPPYSTALSSTTFTPSYVDEIQAG